MAKKYYDEHGNEVKLKKRGGCFKWVGIMVVFFVVLGALSTMLGLDDDGAPSEVVDATSQGEAAASKTSSEEPDVQIFAIGDKVTTKNFELTITDKSVAAEVSDDSGFLSSTADGTYLILDITYKNVSNKMETLTSSSFQVTSGDVQYSPVTIIGMKNNIFLDSINPGIEKTGQIYYDVPEEVAQSEELILNISSSIFGNSGKATIELK